ncbi:Cytosolic Fe-S cluster assembly factor nar1 [Ceratobasidium sp. 414]|nr:Cytosolic Fe-S cluster assembly factor nar1 [Ceratobasidium sp. 414]
MKAIVINGYAHPAKQPVTHNAPEPAPAADEVVVEVYAAALNFFDILQSQGKYQNQPPFPFVLGAEFAGVIANSSPIPKGCPFKPGDRVFGSAQGTYAERVAAKWDSLHPIPAGFSFEQAAGLFVTWPTSYEALVGRAQLQPVHAAAGGVGLAAVQIAKALGAKVIATAGTEEKLQVCKSLGGADEVLDYTKPGWQKQVLKLTNGKGADVIYDPVGLIKDSLKCIAWKGRALVVGFAAGQIEKLPMNLVLLKNISIVGVHWGAYMKNDIGHVPSVWKALFDSGLVPTVYPQIIRERASQTRRVLRGVPSFDMEYRGLDNVSKGLGDLEQRKTWGKAVVRVRGDSTSPSCILYPMNRFMPWAFRSLTLSKSRDHTHQDACLLVNTRRTTTQPFGRKKKEPVDTQFIRPGYYCHYRTTTVSIACIVHTIFTMVFSRGLTLTDLNDFITPSQACIKPVEEVKAPRVENAAATQIGIDSAGVYYEEDSGENGRRKLQQAQVSLNDCLACSGCITSAESVLISMQSHEEVIKAVESNPPPSHPDHKTLVMSIAPQSLASLAASLDPPATTRQILRRVEAFASRTLSFSHVYDTTFARHITLLEHTREFLERRGDKPGREQLPMIASACPGWVCYVEKAHSEMIPFLSRTKSPQQVMGTLVKEWLAKKWGKSADAIYHVTVMPCYDKKLEASRQDFYNDILSTRDVDCVLTTAELEILIRDKGWDISAPVPGEDEPKTSCEQSNVDDAILPELVQHLGSSSGSYLQSLIDLISTTACSPSVSTKTIRTADYEEYTLVDEAAGGKVLFRGAKCYGFRNLQNIVRKVGRDAGISVGRGAAGRIPARGRRAIASREEPKSYDYVEVMACPSGCVNGGGQLRGGVRADGDAPESAATRDARWGDKQLVKDVEAVYWQGAWTPPPSPGSSPRTPSRDFTALDTLAARILRDLCQPKCVSDKWSDEMDEQAESSRRALFRTSFRAVESEVVGLAVQW